MDKHTLAQKELFNPGILVWWRKPEYDSINLVTFFVPNRRPIYTWLVPAVGLEQYDPDYDFSEDSEEDDEFDV